MVGILELTSNIYLCVIEGIKNLAGLTDLYVRLIDVLKSIMSGIGALGK